ncbi:MAG: cytochrome c [Planctomycetes bacterium]|nr:cytochrome c [Planctomycetota bacterium]
MRKCIAIGIVAVAFLASAVVAEDPENKKEPSFWMKQKLKYSQEILNGLAQEDYELITKNAMTMKGLNKIEAFVRQKPEGYRTQLKTFQFSVNELVRSAENENLDGAVLAFTQMTISCVNCHKQLRTE